MKSQLEYNHWANECFIEKIQSFSIGNAHEIMGHILSVQSLWLDRINVEPFRYGIWERIPVDQWRKLNNDNYQRSLSILEHKALEDMVAYEDHKGVFCVKWMKDIFTHVSMHGAYHRGQLAILLRQNNHSPPITDYSDFISEDF